MNETIWTCADGRKIALNKMTDSHVLNALRRFRELSWPRFYDDIYLGDDMWVSGSNDCEWQGKPAHEWVEILEKEASKRGLIAKEPAHDPA